MKKLHKIAFRVDAGPDVGLGHIVRCIAFACELRDQGAMCWFNGNSLACRLAVREGFPVVNNATGEVPQTPADVWIVDLQRGCPPDIAEGVRPLCDTLVILNGVGWSTDDPARLLADLVFYQGMSQRPYELDWDDWMGEWYEGADWVILRREFQSLRRVRTEPHEPPRILASGGGADKGGASSKLVGARTGRGYEIRVIIGPAPTDPKFRQAWMLCGDVEVLENPANSAQAMAWADVAVVSYGMTALECLCLGIPTLALSLCDEQREGANLASARSGGALVSLNNLDGMKMIVKGVLAAIEVNSRRALAFIDGEGVGQVADKIMGGLEW